MIKRRKIETPEVPVAPMLDLAFNLLTFFILTFSPAPVEAQFQMSLLPAQEVARPEDAPQEAAPSDAPAALRSIVTELRADADGRLASITLNQETQLTKIDELRTQLSALLKDPDLQFDQALIRVDSNLQYSELVQIIDLYTSLNLTKVSFAPLGQ